MKFVFPFFATLFVSTCFVNCHATVAATQAVVAAQPQTGTAQVATNPETVATQTVTVAVTQPEVTKKSYIQQVTYGGDKGASVFNIRSEHAIQWAVKQFHKYIKSSQKEHKPLHTFYTKFIGENTTGLAKFRRDIAFETSTSSKEVFGILRTKDTAHLLDYTPIRKSWHDDVADYFGRLMSHLHKNEVDHIVHVNSPRSQNSLYVMQQDYCLDDRNIPLSRDLLVKHYRFKSEDLPDDVVLKMAQHESVCLDELFFCPPNGNVKRELRIQQRQKDLLRVLKYDTKIKIGGTMIPSSVIYGYYQSDSTKPNGVTKESITALGQRSHFIVMHAPKDSVPILMKAVEELWAKALLRDHSDVKGMKDDMANLFYIQTHAMPYSRGSEAMTKWILEAVARYHGWTVVYPEEYGFQDPFQLTIDDFVAEFHVRVKLIPYIQKQIAEQPKTGAVAA